MRKARPALGAALIILASILALSCNNNYGIFQSVQAEKAQDGSKIFQKTTAYTAFMLGTNYYASTARLVRRNVADGSSWSQVAIGGSSTYFLRSVVLAGPTIYALVGADSSSIALYSSTDGDTWSQITPLPTTSVVAHASSTYAVDALFAANNELFVMGHTFIPAASSGVGASYYDLYHLNGSTFDQVSNFTDLTTTIRGVVGDGSHYWFAAEDRLYSGGTNPNGSDAAAMTVSNTVWGISYTGSPGHLYISTKEGNLYQDNFATVDNVATIPLTAVVSVPNAANFILVGTDTIDINSSAQGYYEGTFNGLQKGGDSSIVSSTSSIYNTTVSTFPVHSFFWDNANSNLFVCISPGPSNSSFYGLYMSHWNSSAWTGWSAQ
jgi:hypothetical protein